MSEASRNTFFGADPGAEGDVVVIGAPYAHGSSQSGGAARAPATLRALTRGERINDGIWDYATRKRVIDKLRVCDLGDFVFRASMGRTSYRTELEETALTLALRGAIPLGLGGDHSITLPLARGVARAHQQIQLLQLDAHHDYASIGAATRPTHANFIGFLATCPQILRIVQVGVRGYSSLLPIPPERVVESSIATLDQSLIAGVPTYLTIDTDAFSPSHAPAVMHPVPGGLCWEDLDRVLAMLAALRCPLVGVDWTEYVPELEQHNHPTGLGIVFALVRVLAAIQTQRYGA